MSLDEREGTGGLGRKTVSEVNMACRPPFFWTADKSGSLRKASSIGSLVIALVVWPQDGIEQKSLQQDCDNMEIELHEASREIGFNPQRLARQLSIAAFAVSKQKEITTGTVDLLPPALLEAELTEAC